MTVQEDIKVNEVELTGFQRFSLRRVKADTLQGRIYDAYDHSTNSWVIVKETFRNLVQAGRSRDGHRVPENFHREREIHKLLSNEPDCDDGFVKLLATWDDENCHYNAMEPCKSELFDHVRRIHQQQYASYVQQRQASPQTAAKEPDNEWIRSVIKMFKQLVKTVAWFHKHNICHLDLSLENTMIKDDQSIKIKIIDFGLAEKFPDHGFRKRGRVGKLGYMAPEVYNQQEYDPRAADIWSLGVMLFMMLIGAPPYEFPNEANLAFKFIITGKMNDVLTHWRRLPLVTIDALDLMNRIFRPQDQRIEMEDLLRHPFVNLIENKEHGQQIQGQQIQESQEADESTESKDQSQKPEIKQSQEIQNSQEVEKSKNQSQKTEIKQSKTERLDEQNQKNSQNDNNEQSDENYASEGQSQDHDQSENETVNENEPQNENVQHFAPDNFNSEQARHISQQILDKKQTVECLNEALELIDRELTNLRNQDPQVPERVGRLNESDQKENSNNKSSTIASLAELDKLKTIVKETLDKIINNPAKGQETRKKTEKARQKKK